MQQLFRVLKQNITACLCLDPMWLNQVFKRPVHRKKSINDIHPKLMNMPYMTYHLPFVVMSAGDMFQQKIEEIFKNIANALSTANGILNVGYDTDDRSHNKTMEWVMQICQQKIWNQNKNVISGTRIPCFREIISRNKSTARPKEPACANLNANPK